MEIQKGTLCEKCIFSTRTVIESKVENLEAAVKSKTLCISLCGTSDSATVRTGGFFLLDFGRELTGGIRIITTKAPNGATAHIRFGESVSEALAPIGQSGACNDHSPRDINVTLSALSDLTFGQTAFRFVRIENTSSEPLTLYAVAAVSRTEEFPRNGFIKTNDRELNRILDTAARTLHLCCQNGFIWDGVKRDRLVWSGDLHQEILTALYLFGNIENLRNSISFLGAEAEKGWINTMPAYSAWWILNLCDYSKISGDREFLNTMLPTAHGIIHRFNQCVNESGDISVWSFLDWQSNETEDAVTGTALLYILAAQRLTEYEPDVEAECLCRKLEKYLDKEVKFKQARAFQILAGGSHGNALEFIENGGAAGISTFMCYYILSAYAELGGEKSLEIIKEYFGGMLSKGATSFWEDFDMEWLKSSGRIDELPQNGLKDIHGDYGAYCYKGFRHSLCHGWSSGVYAFFIERILGIKIENGALKEINPRVPNGLTVEAEIPLNGGILSVSVKDGKVEHRTVS